MIKYCFRYKRLDCNTTFVREFDSEEERDRIFDIHMKYAPKTKIYNLQKEDRIK